MTRKRYADNGTKDWFSSKGVDWLKIATLVFFGGVFWNQFNESQKSTEQRFADFRIATEKRDDRMEKMQDAQNALVTQLVEIRGDMKNLTSGVQDIKTTLSTKPTK